MPLQEELESQGNWLFRYRSFLPLVILLIGGTVYLWGDSGEAFRWLQEKRGQTGFELACLAVSLVGSMVRLYTVAHAPVNTSGRNTSEGQVADSLNTTGIYSAVRHPLYVGNFIMWLGVCLLTANVWFVVIFCLLYALYYERIMYAEEQFLRRKFGEQYTQWGDKVPAFFPDWSRFVAPKHPFNWRKVLRSEKSTTVNLFAVFCLFDVGGYYLRSAEAMNLILIGLLCLSLLAYVIIKVLEKNSNVLNV
ncbi:MAG: isoprenylcysteine carboxylmethyltransferase family protein [Saprospiraceae bacterium]|nr:isoprenylcysteine carboxylmethyltransferase family protein [Saprospiraceae bacterium]HMW40149.1 isoprenylcysteine carboxylmethyltransferase family protein [Saprospiraceae bacterium]HMX88955.1 isoprenylcysteine carboxylmethyltransferase family protein [Saprospiraceae bacterium]HMZ40162.1 isoprenylcysteine carboxylmethyltransferase family protein [Saprospiraceae bacterium]HNA64906.1 isoprenylcysteine carboxylmethyltransferase family protein [Saprospiraceae bacterium]